MECKLVKKESQLKIFNLGNKQISTIITLINDAPGHCFQTLLCTGITPGGLVKLQIPVELGQGMKFCISNKLPIDDEEASPCIILAIASTCLALVNDLMHVLVGLSIQ